MCSLGWLIGQNILGFNSRMDNIQQRIYILESMVRQGEASSSNMKELFKLQAIQYLEKYGQHKPLLKVTINAFAWCDKMDKLVKSS
jgi:hypothetical protein